MNPPTTFCANRRFHLKSLAATTVAAMAWPMRQALAQSYPARPIRWIIPYGAGGGSDISARLTAKYWEPAIGGNFVIDNKPGGQTIIGTQGLLTAPADGHTILSVVENLPILPAMYKTLPFNAERDFEFISTTVRMPFFILVRSDSPIKTLKDAISKIKADGDRMNYGSYGIGGTSHLAMEALCDAVNARMTHIPYQGAAACMNALLAGDIDIIFADTFSSAPFVKGERVRPLAISIKERSPAFQSIPTLHEEGIKDFNWYGWQGIVALRNTPESILAKLRETLRNTMQNSALQKEFMERGWDIFMKSPDEFKQYIASEAETLRSLVKRRNIKITAD